MAGAGLGLLFRSAGAVLGEPTPAVRETLKLIHAQDEYTVNVYLKIYQLKGEIQGWKAAGSGPLARVLTTS